MQWIFCLFKTFIKVKMCSIKSCRLCAKISRHHIRFVSKSFAKRFSKQLTRWHKQSWQEGSTYEYFKTWYREKKRNKKFARIHISSILVPKCIFNSYYKIKKWKTIREKCIISFFFSSAVLISLEISQNKNGVNYASRKFI